MDSAGALVLLLIGFSFLIFVHELGHFFVAKWVGIKVTQFAIGFGPAILAWRKGMGMRFGSTEGEFQAQVDESDLSVGETEYRLNWLPLGGYVKMLGQDDMDPGSRNEDPRSFTAKPVWARACVISAGVVMNLIFALLFFIVCFLKGVAFPPNIVGSVSPNSPAAQTFADGYDGQEAYRGLRPGDVITQINGEPIEDFLAIKMAAGLGRRGQAIELTVERESETLPLIYRVVPTQGPAAIEKIMWIGLSPPLSLKIGKPAEESELPPTLSRAGIEPGMKLIAVDGREISQFHQWENMVNASEGQTVIATFRSASPDGKSIDVPMASIPEMQASEAGVRHLLGMVPPVKIEQVMTGKPAHAAGLKVGDFLTRLGNRDWPDVQTLIQTVGDSKGEPLALSVFRDGKEQSLGLVTTFKGKLGFHFSNTNSNRVGQVLPDTSLERLSLVRGSRVIALNEQPVANFGDMQRILGRISSEALAASPQPKEATVTGDAQDAIATLVSVRVTYQLNVATDPIATEQIPIDYETARELAQAGWQSPNTSTFKRLEIPVVARGPLHATVLGLEKTRLFMMQTYLTLLRLIQGTVTPRHLRGPVGIVEIGTVIAREKGWTFLLFFLGLISVNLVVINFLPIPIVDGGLMMFLIIEKLKGSPVSVRVQSAATIVGLALIIAVFVTVTWFDVVRLFLRFMG